MTHKYLNTKQAAEYVGEGTNPRTIVSWMKDGKLQYVRNPSARGRYKTTTEWIDAALKAGADSPTPQAVPVFFEAPGELMATLADNPIRHEP